MTLDSFHDDEEHSGRALAALEQLAHDVADVIQAVDAEVDGQYGDGLGSEDEEDQIRLIFEALAERDAAYARADFEAGYPDSGSECDIILDGGVPVEAKLLRYWRGGSETPEPAWYKHVFSPFNRNTLMTDAHRLCQSDFAPPGGLLGLFYQRAAGDPKTVGADVERFSAETLAEKVVHEVDYWYDCEATVVEIAPFDGLQHVVHERGAAITWAVE